MDTAEYKNFVLGLLSLRFVSDSIEEIHKKLENGREHLSDLENRDEYLSRNFFWVPPEKMRNFMIKNTIEFSNYFNNATDAITMFMLNVR
jgi:type I restriction enzyme M protein